MSLGATMAWTICTNRAGVWIFRPTLVFRTVVSDEILSRIMIFELFLLFESITASAVPGVLPRRCKGMREYVHKTTAIPGSAGYGGGSRMRRYISIVFVRQFDFIL